MKSSAPAHSGFTLIELVVTLTVVTVLLLIAVPSFQSFRQRAALRGAAEQVLGVWNQSRLEAAKRNVNVEVAVTGSAGAPFCIGATTVEAGNNTPCDCTETDPADADYCDVTRFPLDQGEWKSVSLAATPTLGSTTGAGRAIIEPKNTTLTIPADAGVIALKSPPGPRNYRVNLSIDAFGRGRLCESKLAGVNTMSDYADRRCDP